MLSPDYFEENAALFGGNAVFLQELYSRYVKDPKSVDESWQRFFAGFADDARTVMEEARGASWAPRSAAIIGIPLEEIKPAPGKDGKGKAAPAAAPSEDVLRATALDSIRALMLIRAYRVMGHYNATLDPLGLERKDAHPELDPHSYGFTEADFDRPIFLGGVLGLQEATVRQIMGILEETYASTIGFEFMHIQYPDQKAWLQEHIELLSGKPRLDEKEKRRILRNLVEVESFETFLQVKYPSTKRFSIQGGDAGIAGLESAILAASDLGVEEIVLGMPHRGRMNVLTTIMGKPYVELLSIFQGSMDVPEWVHTSGDVKYHLGVSNDRVLENGKTVHLSLTANPSHLEAVNPVVLGKVRAKQDQRQDEDRSKVLPILLHGDAAFIGQGPVAETLMLSDLKGYRVGGTVHIVINNQIGFTTSPKSARSSPYPTDLAKAVQAPVFHVNGNDAEAVAFVSRLAVEFRQKFKRDVVIDVVCYRKFGHNESDEPMFTQPQMYTAISRQKLPARIYAERLISEGVLTEQDLDNEFRKFREYFDKEFEAAKSYKPNKADWLGGYWSGFERPSGEHASVETGVDLTLLKQVGEAISRIPEGVNLNKKIVRQLEAKQEMIKTGAGIDWATGEALAYGTLVAQGYPVRLTGQDSCRGTFSQRHSVLIDQITEERYIPLNNLGIEQQRFEVHDSNLSEFAILGFEYGYSLSEPRALTLWEAQFGDFANGAQVIIDQFISSGEIKWLRMSGLVMLLPHGYEGQGPEHSSARLERYLQLCAEDNMQVANCTTPASYFHILRRQLLRNFRKPLVIMTPKSLLRHKLAVSTLKDMAKGTAFRPVIAETEKLVADNKVRRVVLCSGKVYYDLYEERERQKINDIALVRVEQLYPYPGRLLAEVFARYPKAQIVWCQEEPKNMGAWSFIWPLLEETLEDVRKTFTRVHYVGRAAAASPATGYLKTHEHEQKTLVQEALS